MFFKGIGYLIKLKLVLRLLNVYFIWFGVVVDDIKLIYDIIFIVGKELVVIWIKYKVGIIWKIREISYFFIKV